MTFELQNRLRNRKGEKMKNLCFIKGTPMFWRVQASLFGSKNHEKTESEHERDLEVTLS